MLFVVPCLLNTLNILFIATDNIVSVWPYRLKEQEPFLIYNKIIMCLNSIMLNSSVTHLFICTVICSVLRHTKNWWCPANRGGKWENDLSSLGSALFRFPHQQNKFHWFSSCIICLKSTSFFFFFALTAKGQIAW